jgi:hypothetical protein
MGAAITIRRRVVKLLNGAAAGAIIIFYCSAALAQNAPPSPEEMWAIIQEQSRLLEEQRSEIDALKLELGMVQTSQEEPGEAVEEVQEVVTEAQAAAVEAQLAALDIAAAAGQGADPLLGVSGLEPNGTGGGWWDRTSLGGYSELHYQGGSRDQIDLHRFVILLGHEFTNDIRFFSELEVEHALAGDTKPGEVQLEQAYVQIDVNNQNRINAGLQPLPLGIINETHEPPTFFGVERNPVESNIIPSTWWEAGIGVNGNFGATGISYDLLASSGLDVLTTDSNAFRPRKGRQKVASAPAKSPALTGRVSYTGTPGLELAVSGHYEFDITQSPAPGTAIGDLITNEKVPAFLFTTHADARFGGFGLRALFASWWIDSVAASEIGRDRQTGFYLEPSYRFPFEAILIGGVSGEAGLFYRYSLWDNNAGMSSLNLGTDQHVFGVNYWPHPNVVFKLDYLMDRPKSGENANRVDAGVGFQF